MIAIEQVWRLIDRKASRLPEENVPLDLAVGRVLAAPVRAVVDQPPFDQSAMDGFALGALPGKTSFRVVAHIAAGHAASRRLRPGEAARILTGGMVPRGAVAVARQEDCTTCGDMVRVRMPYPSGANIRRRGAILRAGAEILSAGRRFLPGAAGLLAACGVSHLLVVRRPRIEHLITGDEILSADRPLAAGHLRDANGPLLRALLGAMGLRARQKHLPDSAAALRRATQTSEADLVLISGGSGSGERDHARAAIEAAGFAIHCSSVNSRPGRPLIFASRGKRLAFGLPGNPLAHFVGFHAFVRRALARMEGSAPPRFIKATLRAVVRDPGDGRRSWFPARLTSGARGNEARLLSWKHSGDLTPLVEANALLLDDGDARPPRAGDCVALLPTFDTMEDA